jgi:hypothetical protein
MTLPSENTSGVSPALSEAEWSIVQQFTTFPIRGIGPMAICHIDDPHAVAAIALHGQPFGFTSQHVAFLRWLADSVLRTDETRHACRVLADRIQALLPPRDTPDNG